METINCIILLFETFLWLAAFSILTRAQISDDTTIYPDLMASRDMKDYCFTPECIHTASRVLRFIDKSIEPCDDFYKFSCGQLLKEEKKFGYHSDHFSVIAENIRRLMENYLQSETLPTEPRYVRLMKTFYKNCIDELNSEDEPDFNLILELINKAGGWPLLRNDSLEDENFQWEKFGSQVDNVTILENNFISIMFFEDPKYSSKRIINIYQPSRFYASQADYNKLITIPQLFGVEQNVTRIYFNQINEVDKKLYRIINRSKDRRSVHEKMTIQQLSQNYSNILWEELFNTFLKPKTISDDDVILVGDISYFNEFNQLITTISKKDQANYLMWRAIYTILEKFVKSINNESNAADLCYDSVVDIFDQSFGALYFRKFFNEDSNLENVDEMFDNIYDQFNATLYNNAWMDQKTKLKALKKLASMFIVAPTQYLSHNESEIDEFFKNLEITRGNYFQSLINITSSVKHTKNVDLFRKPLRKGSWLELPRATIVNGQSVFDLNRFVTPPGVFQGVFFHEKRPQYMNYGGIGSGIGHEMIHFFDNIGRKYNERGFFENWWSAESNEVFLDKAQCIINQYNNYTVKEVGLNVNGENTLNENIADNGGIKVAYLAYEKYVETHGDEPLLPGVNYTQRQLFWISFAHFYCDSRSSTDLSSDIYNDPHSPNEFRVVGSVSNRPEFARDFGCAVGTKMNPKNTSRCSVW